jgi:hypothetical protein
MRVERTVGNYSSVCVICWRISAILPVQPRDHLRAGLAHMGEDVQRQCRRCARRVWRIRCSIPRQRRSCGCVRVKEQA